MAAPRRKDFCGICFKTPGWPGRRFGRQITKAKIVGRLRDFDVEKKLRGGYLKAKHFRELRVKTYRCSAGLRESGVELVVGFERLIRRVERQEDVRGAIGDLGYLYSRFASDTRGHPLPLQLVFESATSFFKLIVPEYPSYSPVDHNQRSKNYEGVPDEAYLNKHLPAGFNASGQDTGRNYRNQGDKVAPPIKNDRRRSLSRLAS
ncbi:hypothetical protein KM043_009891 [Ampulex compressa]|nr:hypothetical protein KM043_009891 [Ampulex compressa]